MTILSEKRAGAAHNGVLTCHLEALCKALTAVTMCLNGCPMECLTDSFSGGMCWWKHGHLNLEEALDSDASSITCSVGVFSSGNVSAHQYQLVTALRQPAFVLLRPMTASAGSRATVSVCTSSEDR